MDIIIGGGTDAGGIIIHPDGTIERFPGWDPQVLLDLTRSLNVIREAALLKTPGLAQAAISSVMGFVQKELGSHIEGSGGVLVIGER